MVVRSLSRLFAIVLLLCMMMLLCLVCFKPWKELRSLEHERAYTQAHLDEAKAKMERAKKEFIWISQDPYYYEIIARDKSNLALPDEHILRIKKEDQRLK